MHIFLDGKTVEARIGETIYDAAQRAGIDIPALCRFPDGLFDKTNPPSTSCLVCLVKVNNRFVPSCATAVEDGMSIESETDEVHEMRRSALELLLSDHIEHCRTCGTGRKKCRLLKYMAKYKADRNRFRIADAPDEIETAILENDKVVYDARKCIKCGICVALTRQNGESIGLTFLERGFNTRIGMPFDEPLHLGIDKSAEALAAACPTAALTYLGE